MSEAINESLKSVVKLARSRRRWFRCISFSECLLVLLCLAAAVVTADLWLSFDSVVRWGAWALLVGSALAWCLKAIVRTRSEYTAHEAAVSMEAAEPEMGQKIRTALDIASQEEDTVPDMWGFRQKLVTETGELLGRYDWRRLIPRARAMQWLSLVGVAVLGIFFAAMVSWEFRLGLERLLFPGTGSTYTQVAWDEVPEWFDQSESVEVSIVVSGRVKEPKLFARIEQEWEPVEVAEMKSGVWMAVLSGYRQDIEVYAEAGDGKAEVRKIVYDPLPELVEAKVHLRFPDYIEKDEEERSGGDVSAVEGTEVQWSFVFNTVPKEIFWTVPGRGGPENPDIGTEVVTSSLILEEGMVYPNLSVVDRRGRTVEAWRFRAEGVKDQLPEVEILEPAEDLGATRVTEVPVRIRVKDDFGLSEVGVVLEANGEKKWLLERVIQGNGELQINDMVVAMLEEIPLELHDSVRVYAYALDRKQRGGPRGLSPLLSIDIHQFERRWIDGGVAMPIDAELIKALGQIIREQREVVSTLFVVNADTYGALGAGLVGTCREQSEKETGLGDDTDTLIEKLKLCGCVPKEDLDMMGIAADQMREAAEALAVPEAGAGMRSADSALENLLALRKKMITIIKKGMGKPCELPPTEKLPRHLSEIAEDYRELAGEERDLGQQIENGDGNNVATNPKVLKRQQTVATALAGELYAELLSHPQKTVGVLTLADEAETVMAEAEIDILADQFQGALPELETAEARLLEVASFLEILEEQILSEAMEEMAEMMAKIAAKMEMEFTDLGGTGSGDMPQEASSSSEEESSSEEGEAESESEAASEGEGQTSGEGEMAETGEDGDDGPEGESGKGSEEEMAAAAGESGEEGKGDVAENQSGESKGGSPGDLGENGEEGEEVDVSSAMLAEAEAEADTDGLARGGGDNGDTGKGGEGEKREGGSEGMSGFAGKSGSGGSGVGSGEEDETEPRKKGESKKGLEDKEGGEMASASEKKEGSEEPSEGKPGDLRKSKSDSRSQSREQALSEAARSLQLADRMMAALAERGMSETQKGAFGSENGQSDRDGKPGKESEGAAVGKLRKALGLKKLANKVLSSDVHAQENRSAHERKKSTAENRSGEGRGKGKSSGTEASSDEPSELAGQNDENAPALVQEIREASKKIQDLAVQFAANRSTQLADVKADLKEIEQDSLDAMSSEQSGHQSGAAEEKEIDSDRDAGDGTSLSPFLDKVVRLQDAKMGAWGREMASASEHRKRLPLIGKMEARIDELARELPRSSAAESGDRDIPEESRRDVLDYFRDLSDDFGGESWVTPK